MGLTQNKVRLWEKTSLINYTRICIWPTAERPECGHKEKKTGEKGETNPTIKKVGKGLKGNNETSTSFISLIALFYLKARLYGVHLPSTQESAGLTMERGKKINSIVYQGSASTYDDNTSSAL